MPLVEESNRKPCVNDSQCTICYAEVVVEHMLTHEVSEAFAYSPKNTAAPHIAGNRSKFNPNKPIVCNAEV